MNKRTEDKIKKIGRPPKKDYDAEKQFKKLLDTVDFVYESTKEIKTTADELNISPIKVKKLLITSGKLEYEETKQIQRLLSMGKKLTEIQKEMGLKISSINSYLPYTKVPYKDEEVSANADRCDLYRTRRRAVEALETGGEEELWNAIAAFENYTFFTADGVKFKYCVSRDTNGNKKRELIINDGTKKSKHITWKAVMHVYGRVENMMYNVLVEDGLDCNIKYLLSIFARLGVLSAPNVNTCLGELRLVKENSDF